MYAQIQPVSHKLIYPYVRHGFCWQHLKLGSFQTKREQTVFILQALLSEQTRFAPGKQTRQPNAAEAVEGRLFDFLQCPFDF